MLVYTSLSLKTVWVTIGAIFPIVNDDSGKPFHFPGPGRVCIGKRQFSDFFSFSMSTHLSLSLSVKTLHTAIGLVFH